jgi:short-subunit dehydrogenase
MPRLVTLLGVLVSVLLAVPLRSLLMGMTIGEKNSGAAFARQYGPWGLVIGASRGLGSAWAHGLAERGLNVILTGRVQKTLNEACEELQAKFPKQKFVGVLFDAGDVERTENVSASLNNQYEIGIVITNAVFTPLFQPFVEVPRDDLLKSLNLNVFGISRVVQIFGANMRKRQRGGFVLVGSVAGHLGITNMAVYSSTKAFLSMFAETLWNELRQDNIDVIAPQVGQTTTPSLDDFINPEFRVKLIETSPQNVVLETMYGLGRTPFVYTGWATKAQVFAAWLVPHQLGVPVMASLSQNLFQDDDNLQARYDQIGRKGRTSRT